MTPPAAPEGGDDTEMDPDEVLIFFRSGLFYSIRAVKGISLSQQAQDNAELNPGTLRIEDARQNVLWRLQ